MRQKDWYLTEEREPGFFHCEDYEDASFYLLEGTEKALLIDTGMGEGDFRVMLKKLTRSCIVLHLREVRFCRRHSPRAGPVRCRL